jgi:hypothetical protein
LTSYSIAADLKLQSSIRPSNLSTLEVEARTKALRACFIYDRHWALIFGQRISTTSFESEAHQPTRQLDLLSTCVPVQMNTLNSEIYESFLRLLSLAGNITKNTCLHPQAGSMIDYKATSRLVDLSQQFERWYAQLPDSLKWTSTNIHNATPSFFLLHQQYHTILILLHHPLTMYQELDAVVTYVEEESRSIDQDFSSPARVVCAKHAINVVRSLCMYTQSFDAGKIFITGLQQANTAANALVVALRNENDPSNFHTNLEHLGYLVPFLEDLASTYQPAAHTVVMAQATINEMGAMPREVQSLLRSGTVMATTHRESASLGSSKYATSLKLFHPCDEASIAHTASMDTDKVDSIAAKELEYQRPETTSVLVSSLSEIANSRSVPLSISCNQGAFSSSHQQDDYTRTSNMPQLNSWEIEQFTGVHFPELRCMFSSL